MKEKTFEDYRRLTKEQMPGVRRLVKQCCNYDGGECIALDDGAGCVCVQTISYSLLCRWFRAAVLPLDPVLEASLLGGQTKRCANCGEAFVPGSNRAKYCPACSKKRRKTKEAKRQRERYAAHKENTTQAIIGSYGELPQANFLRDVSTDSIRKGNEKVKTLN